MALILDGSDHVLVAPVNSVREIGNGLHHEVSRQLLLVDGLVSLGNTLRAALVSL